MFMMAMLIKSAQLLCMNGVLCCRYTQHSYGVLYLGILLWLLCFSPVSASATMNFLLVARLSYLNALYRHVDANRCCRSWINKPDRSFQNPNSESPI